MKLSTLLVLVAILTVTLAAQQGPYKYPAAKKVDQVDDFFGTKVADPYRWLEDSDAPRHARLDRRREQGHLRVPRRRSRSARRSRRG